MAKKEAELLLRIRQVGAEAIDKVASSIGTLKTVAVAAFTAISGVVALAIKNYGEQEQATNKLNQALINQGIYTRTLSEEYQALATALQKKSSFADEEIIQAQATLQAYVGQTKLSKELVQATLDLAAAKGMDLASASDLIGKTIGTETNALGRHGIEIDKNASKQERMAAIIGQVNAKWHGQAEATTLGLGAIGQMNKALGEMLEVIGERVAPVIIFFAKEITNLADSVTSTNPVLDVFVDGLILLGKAAVLIFGALKELGNGFAALGASIAAAFNAPATIDGAKQLWESLKSINQAANEEAVRIQEETKAKLKALDDAEIASKQEKADREVDMVNQSLANQAMIRQLHRDEEKIKDDEFFAIKSAEELAKMEAHNNLLLGEQTRKELESLNRTIKNETDRTKVLEAEQKKRQILTTAYAVAELNSQEIQNKKMAEAEAKFQVERQQTIASSLSTIATMQNAKTTELMVIGKAAALAQVAISTAVGIMRAFEFLGPFGFPAAAAIGAAGVVQAANIAGVQLAEGGIVKSRPGGIQATIGEGGRDEAVIPLDDDRAAGVLGSNITIVVNGGLMGDAASAREFARAIDRELYRMRQSNESISMPGVV